MNAITKLESILTDHTITMVLIMVNAVPGDATTKALSGTETQAHIEPFLKYNIHVTISKRGYVRLL